MAILSFVTALLPLARLKQGVAMLGHACHTILHLGLDHHSSDCSIPNMFHESQIWHLAEKSHMKQQKCRYTE
eukprot:4571854-Amphidinium_carterae.1